MAYTTIDKPTDFFVTNLWTGNNTAQTITGLDFQPDFVWIKNRSTSEDHVINDAPRGANNYLRSNTVNSSGDNTEFLKSFTSDGYTLGNADQVNNGSNLFVGWNWKANGAGASNTDGSTNSTKTSANTTSMCSIVTYTGNDTNSTVGHGLGVVPASIWVKQLNGNNEWRVFHKELGATHYLALNTTAGDSSSGEVIWNDVLPTSSVFTIGTNGTVNGGSDTYVAYCFAEVQGFSKIDRYFGNGNADGAYVYTGFKPAWVMIKRADAAGDSWLILDTKRQGYNGGADATQGNLNIIAEGNSGEGNEALLDIYSNGFKIKVADTKINGSGNGYVYWAFAENPIVTSTGVPTTAR